MDKRKEENRRVRQAITRALLELMCDNPLSSIPVTRIIERAGVARVSFYRNYSSKEDVLAGYVQDVLEEFSRDSDHDITDRFSLVHVQRTLEYFQRNKAGVLLMHDAGYSSMFLDELNYCHATLHGDFKMSSAEKYKNYVFIGAMYNTAVNWLREEDPAPSEAVARSFLEAFGHSGP